MPGRGLPRAVGVALIYALSIGLLLMLVAFFTNPDAVGHVRGREIRLADAASATLAGALSCSRVVFIPDFGVFTDHPERPDR